MDIPMVAIPVRCPKCGALGLSEFPVLVVAVALVKWNNMCLHAPCHEGGWDASDKELQAIRRHLGRDWIREHGQAFFKPPAGKVTYLNRGEREHPRRIAAGQVAGVNLSSLSSRPSRPRPARDLN